MKHTIVDMIIADLETAVDFFVPVKKLWETLRDENTPNMPTLEEFTELVKNDGRLVVQQFKEAPWENDPEETEEMESLDYYSGPRVRLKSRVPSKEDIARIIQQNAQKIIDNLIKAYQTRPKNLPEEEEKQLIQAMIKAKKLKDDLEKALKDEKK
ncbi:MAG: hypothetical protein HY811_03715 [Planctomycetes bacterium]|nr:hypothetical protein [Planctomycetota bacterium]